MHREQAGRTTTATVVAGLAVLALIVASTAGLASMRSDDDDDASFVLRAGDRTATSTTSTSTTSTTALPSLDGDGADETVGDSPPTSAGGETGPSSTVATRRSTSTTVRRSTTTSTSTRPTTTTTAEVRTAPRYVSATADRSAGLMSITFDQAVEPGNRPHGNLYLVIYGTDASCGRPDGNGQRFVSGTGSPTVTIEATSLTAGTTYVTIAEGFVRATGGGPENATLRCTAVPTS